LEAEGARIPASLAFTISDLGRSMPLNGPSCVDTAQSLTQQRF
jgi:hypothetical protein